MRRSIPFLLLAATVALSPSAGAQNADFVPKPETYLCPNAAGTASVECFLDAVEHLYTMCRQVKSIEIIEFGYEKSEEGVNGAKSEYCVDKHTGSMSLPYKAALKEVTPHRSVVEQIRALHEQWLASLRELKWKPGESDEDYKARISRPYQTFKERAQAVRAALAESLSLKSASAATPTAPAKASGKSAAKASPKVAPKSPSKSPSRMAAKTTAVDAAKGATN